MKTIWQIWGALILLLGVMVGRGNAQSQPKVDPQQIIVNPVQGNFKVQVRVDRSGENPIYNIGQRITLTVSVNEDAYVYLFALHGDGAIDLILPNQLSSGNVFMRAGETRSFPPANGGGYLLQVDDPVGQDKVLAVASKRQLNIDAIASFKSNQPFATVTISGQSRLAQSLASILKSISPSEWTSGIAYYKVQPRGTAQDTTPTYLLVVQSSTPNARASINGQDKGFIPAGGLQLQLTDSNATIVVTADGYTPQTKSLILKAGSPTRVNIALDKTDVNPTPPPTPSVRPSVSVITVSQRVGPEFTINVRVGNINPGDATFDVTINGDPLPSDNVRRKDVTVGASGIVQLTVRLPNSLLEGEFTIGVIATNKKNGVFSEESRATLEYRARSQVGKPSLYLLAVGLDRYAQEPRISRLNYAAADATAMADVFRTQSNRIFEKVNVTLLTNERATLRNVKSTLSQIRLTARPNDVVMLFFSGHGVVNDDSYYVLMNDTEPEANELDSTALRQSDLRDFIDRTPARTVLFLDTCQAGGITGKSAWSKAVNGLSADLGNSARAPAILTAVTGSQLAVEDSKWGHGAFTYALLEAFKSRASTTSSGDVTMLSLVSTVSSQVGELTNGKQAPVFYNNGPDFPVFRR
jgi:hypothetical protein